MHKKLILKLAQMTALSIASSLFISFSFSYKEHVVQSSSKTL